MKHRPASRFGRGGPRPGELVAKKGLGQNFLVDTRVIGRIVDACDFNLQETVLEIGPGQGALTRQILPRVGRLYAVEKDRALVARLEEEFSGLNLALVHGDFLDFDASFLPGRIKVAGNLPYNISTPIITRVLEQRSHYSVLFMTVQLEFGTRLVARPGSKDYSSLGCLVNYFARPRILFEIGPGAFRPVPGVRSCFMRMDLRDQPAVRVNDEAFFLRLIRQVFLHRRKNLANSLLSCGLGFSREAVLSALDRAGLKPMLRVEQLDLDVLARVSDALQQF